MAIVDLNEEIVGREYERLAPTVPDFCGCVTCREDVIVYALNRLPPHYVTRQRGAVLQHVAMQQGQQVADVAVMLMAGFRIVQESPRPQCSGRAAGGG